MIVFQGIILIRISLLLFRVILLTCMSRNERIENIYIDLELVPPMYNVHPYFSLKNLGKKVCIIHGKIQ